MKKLITFFIIIYSPYTFSQNIAYTEDEFVWCGLDFSMVKLVGSEGFNDVGEIKDLYFKSWNYLLLDEYEKYNIEEAFGKKELHLNLSIVNQRNQLPRVRALRTSEDYDLNEEDLEKIVSDYKGIDKAAEVGLLFVVETLNKSKNHAKVSVVFFEIPTGEIKWYREVTGKPGGLGFRNYWMGAFYYVIKESSYYFKKDSLKYKRRRKN